MFSARHVQSNLPLPVLVGTAWRYFMTTSDYALITSLVSIVIAIGSLLWNVWQKFIFVKPTLQVSFGIYNVLVPTETGTATRTGHRLLNLTVPVAVLGEGVAA
jgi:hypothetical protein